MSVLALSPDFILEKMKALPPQSRKLAGYRDMLREIKKRQLIQETKDSALTAELCRTLEPVLMAEVERLGG